MTRQYLEKILGSINDAVVVASPAGIIERVNGAAYDLTDYAQRELLGKSVATIFRDDLPELLATEGNVRNTRDSVLLTKYGEKIPVSLSRSLMYSDDGEIECFIFVARDITERKKAEKRIRFLARYDPLTKIPNRMQFQHQLQQAIARARRGHRSLALLYLDLDRFKEVNDTYGHLVGDRTLELAVRRLLDALPPGTVIGRLSGDEFAVILEGPALDYDIQASVRETASVLLDRIAETFYPQDQEVFLTASIGAAVFPDDGDNVIDLIRNADTAMYLAKRSSGNTFAFYGPDINARKVDRLILRTKLQRALQRNELSVRYQPTIDLRTGDIVGAEALLRWHSPDRGEIAPAQFIPLAEESNLINEIGDWVLDEVCSDYKSWQTKVEKPGRVAINFSLRQLRQPNVISRVSAIFDKHSVPPSSMELEITESTLMENPSRTIKTLQELFRMGLHLSIDDFGTGYSSLSALQNFPIHTLKIDQSFVRDSAIDDDDATIVSTAEESNLINEIGDWVLDEVCSDYKSWQTKVEKPGRVAINFSLRQLRQPNVISRVSAIFDKHSVPPSSMELEITESTLMENPSRTIKTLQELFRMGLHLSIDDFGTGYSSLSALQNFPIHTLKIDQSFVRDSAIDDDDATIVSTIIEMGRSLQMDVVAEGVETEEQLDFLRKHDCTYAQGHLFGRAVSADDYLELLLEQYLSRSGNRHLAFDRNQRVADLLQFHRQHAVQFKAGSGKREAKRDAGSRTGTGIAQGTGLRSLSDRPAPAGW